VAESPLINIIGISPSPKFLQTSNKLLVLLFAPLKAIWQALALYYAMGYKSKPAEWILLQNPPFIPTFAIASFVAFIRNSKLVVDWHNFGYSLYALKFGASHPLVKLHKAYEFGVARAAYAHFTVTNAMARVLKAQAGVDALPLHDRPPAHFQPLTSMQRNEFLGRFEPTAKAMTESSNWKLLVSSTSWTPDEDFSLLLDALVAYSKVAQIQSNLPRIIAVITGKGPQKAHYTSRIAALTESGALSHVSIHTAWLSATDYALLLGAANLGVSLHMSSSGLDLPMKVVDMFGAGLPVVGWSAFEAWPELVVEGVNGRGFKSTDELTDLLLLLFKDEHALGVLKNGAREECKRRWDEEWDGVAGRVFCVV
jgi:beta-1,4-mannosyltransferase